jgi:PAS domain S-box-containing protein
VRELAALAALSAAWSQSGPPEIADGLAGVLCRALPVAFVYVRVNGATGKLAVEVARTPDGPVSTARTRLIAQATDAFVKDGTADATPTIPNPFGTGALRVAVTPLGYEGDCGFAVIASPVADFPGPTDRLLLGVAANQAVVVLQQRRSEEQLRRSEREWADFFDNATVGLHWVGPDGIILRANRAELELLGYSREEYIGRHVGEFHVTPDVAGDIMRRLRAGEDLRNYEARLRCKDGSIKHVLIDSNVLREDGRFVHSRCFTRDITDRKRAEEALRRQTDLFTTLVERIPDIVSRLDRELRFIYISPAVTADTGRPWQDYIGKPRTDQGLTPEAAQLRRDLSLKVFETGQEQSLELPIRGARGDRVLEWRFIPEFGPNGSVESLITLARDVTDRKRAEEALRESERRFRVFADTAPAVLWVTEPDGSCSFLSRGWYEFTGQTEATALGFGWLDAVHPDDRPAANEKFLAANFAHEPFALEYRLRRSDGEYRWAIDTGRPRFGPDGEFLGYVGSVIDITGRKRAEEALRDSETRFRALVTASSDVVYRMSPDWTEMRHLQGRNFIADTHEPSRSWLAEYIHPDDQPHVVAVIDEAIRTKSPFQLEHRVRRVDGSLGWTFSRAIPILDANGDVVEWFGAASDVTDRRRAEDRLRLLWEAAALMLGADNPEAMLCELFAKIGPHLGLDTYFNYMVDDAGDTLQLASWVGVSDQTARAIARLEFGEAIAGTAALRRQPIVATRIHESDDPNVRLVKLFGIRAYVCHPLISGGHLLGTLSFASRSRDTLDRDEVAFLEPICHYVTVACERLRLLRQLKEADHRKDEFLATLAHELRNPLAPVRNAVQVLRLKGPADPELRWSRDVIDRQVAHLTRLIDDLLDVSRITRNRLELRKEPVELAEVVKGAVETSRPLIEECGHELTLTLPSEPVYVDADLVRLAQVFMNLLTNAAKYTERGGRIWLTAERNGAEVAVRVRDTGVGIPAEKLPRLFEMFFQVDRSLERSQGGLGIGLSLVRRLVELHGGTVKAQSAGLGKGSEFTVRLPVLPGALAVQPTEESPDERALTAATCRRILVVDDARDNADALAMLLQLAGNEVETAYDGLAAVEAAERWRPDVVLLDIGMPKLNGYDACRRIREQPWGTTIVLVALTGWGQEEDKRRTSEAGFDGHLVKPVDPVALTKMLAATRPG